MTVPLQQILDTLRVVSLPMATRFRGVDTREVALLRGPEGWAEFSPFLEYPDTEAATWLAAAIDFAFVPQPAALRNTIGVNATAPAVAPEAVPAVLARFGACRTAKVKVAEAGQVLADDIARVHAVRDALGPEGRIRVDANGAWNLDEAERAVHALAEFDLEYVEQPCATLDELVELRRRIRYLDIPIAADESVRKSADPGLVARAGAADILVIKVQPLGGIRAALNIVATARMPAVVSSALESSVGLAMGIALAAALPQPEGTDAARYDGTPYDGTPYDFDSGLGTAALLAADVCSPALLPNAGQLPVTRPNPDPALLDTHAASPERTTWWQDRIRRCYPLLRAQTR